MGAPVSDASFPFRKDVKLSYEEVKNSETVERGGNGAGKHQPHRESVGCLEHWLPPSRAPDTASFLTAQLAWISRRGRVTIRPLIPAPPSPSPKGGGGSDGLRVPEPGRAVEQGLWVDSPILFRGLEKQVGLAGSPELETSFGGPSQTLLPPSGAGAAQEGARPPDLKENWPRASWRHTGEGTCTDWSPFCTPPRPAPGRATNRHSFLGTQSTWLRPMHR